MAFVGLGAPSAEAETIAVFTKSQTSPIFTALRAGAAVAAKTLGVQIVNYVPSTADSVADQTKLVDDAIKDAPDAIVFVPIDFTKAGGMVERINARPYSAFVNINERLSGGTVVGYVGTDDVALAKETARYLINAMGGEGNLVILDGPDVFASDRAGPRQGLSRRRQGVSGCQTSRRKIGELRASAGQAGDDGVPAQLSPDRRHFGRQRSDGDRRGRCAEILSRKSLVVAGINASREIMDLIKGGDVLGSGDYDSFQQGCLGVEMAVRSLRKEEVPQEVMLKPVVIDKTNDAPFDQPYDKRECPTLASVAGK